MIYVRTTGWGLLGGVITALAMVAVISVFVGGGSPSDAVDAAFYACILAATGGLAFGASRRRSPSVGTAWKASAVAVGIMIVFVVAAYISYFEYVLDGGFGKD